MTKKTKIIIIIAVVLLVGGLVLTGLLMRVDEVNIIGNRHFTAQEIGEFFLREGVESSPLVILANELFGGYEVNALDEYELSFNSLTSVSIVVKERKLYGCVPHLNSYLYFDKNGVVLKSTSERFEDVAEINGLKVEKAVINERLSVEDEDSFKLIETVIDFVNSSEITINGVTQNFYSVIDEITVEGDELILGVDGITVLLGRNISLQEKLMEALQMIPALSGKRGTLHMENYNGGSSSAVCYFEED